MRYSGIKFLEFANRVYKINIAICLQLQVYLVLGLGVASASPLDKLQFASEGWTPRNLSQCQQHQWHQGNTRFHIHNGPQWNSQLGIAHLSPTSLPAHPVGEEWSTLTEWAWYLFKEKQDRFNNWLHRQGIKYTIHSNIFHLFSQVNYSILIKYKLFRTKIPKNYHKQ